MYPKMSFTSSVVMTASTVPVLPEFRSQGNKKTTREVTTNESEQYTVRTAGMHNINLTAPFDSTSTINSITNCNPETSQILHHPTPNTNQISINQRSNQDRPEQIFGTKVTKCKVFFFIFS